jgi:hypothetical protein
MRHVSAFFYLCAVLPFSDIDKIVNRVRPFTRIAVRKKTNPIAGYTKTIATDSDPLGSQKKEEKKLVDAMSPGQ